MNKEIGINLDPLTENLLLNRELNSVFSILIIVVIIFVGREFDFQKNEGINSRVKVNIIQFSWRERNVVGSNIENRLVIIFS